MNFKKDVEIITSDFWYDLFHGGYIKPEELLEDKNDIDNVKNAVEVLKKFYQSAQNNDIIQYL